ncbi:MAG: phytanoyl-CoA dioxygenase family protein [Gammaproteobacteria bacterium]|nr:phytanoyl-CoA dioxygenase family protein [Gammaproteobacteria bacterium]
MSTRRLSYRVQREHMGGGPARRDVTVCATPGELAALDRDGFLIRESVIEGDWLLALKAALDRVAETERHVRRPTVGDDDLPARSWGVILRHLLDKDAVFHDLLTWPPALSVARAMMGPLVRLRGLSARISFAGAEAQDTPWHQHLRVVPNPLPPWFSRPHAIDCLIYLDDLDDSTGVLSLVPGSHHWLDREPPQLRYAPVPGEQTLRLAAGSMVIIHANLWHRALPTRAGQRRVLILSYTPCWLRESPHGGPPPADGLTADLLADGDPEIRELLGLEGHS